MTKECDVEGCNNVAEKAISRDRVNTILRLKSSSGKHANLCKDHYKEWKKKTKKDRKVERLTWV